MAQRKIEECKIGQYYEEQFIITEEIGKSFADISKDYNPVHLEKEFAEQTRFKDKIVHGMLLGSYISGIIGNKFPGQGSIYLKQELHFKRPVYYNSKVKIRVEIKEIHFEQSRLTLQTTCSVEDKTVIDGEAIIMLED